MQSLKALMPTFDEAMGPEYNPSTWRVSKRFKEIYQEHHFENKWTLHEKIPKIIHQIWLGGKVPDQFKSLMQTWKDLHTDWEYHLWTDDSIKTLKRFAQKPFDCMTNLGGKSDILRYEILYQMGGVYVDCDFECLKPLDPLVEAHSFFAGIGGLDYINNAIIGARPFHPLMKQLLDILNHAPSQNLTSPWYHTGPKLFTFQVYQYLKDHMDDGIIYPINFFYPLPNTLRFKYRKGALTQECKDEWIKPYSFGIHYWAESWNH